MNVIRKDTLEVLTSGANPVANFPSMGQKFKSYTSNDDYIVVDVNFDYQGYCVECYVLPESKVKSNQVH
jgi:hypothetical protein